MPWLMRRSGGGSGGGGSGVGRGARTAAVPVDRRSGLALRGELGDARAPGLGGRLRCARRRAGLRAPSARPVAAGGGVSVGGRRRWAPAGAAARSRGGASAAVDERLGPDAGRPRVDIG